jgi:hypothetical protein
MTCFVYCGLLFSVVINLYEHYGWEVSLIFALPICCEFGLVTVAVQRTSNTIEDSHFMHVHTMVHCSERTCNHNQIDPDIGALANSCGQLLSQPLSGDWQK